MRTKRHDDQGQKAVHVHPRGHRSLRGQVTADGQKNRTQRQSGRGRRLPSTPTPSASSSGSVASVGPGCHATPTASTGVSVRGGACSTRTYTPTPTSPIWTTSTSTATYAAAANAEVHNRGQPSSRTTRYDENNTRKPHVTVEKEPRSAKEKLRGGSQQLWPAAAAEVAADTATNFLHAKATNATCSEQKELRR